jgi:hypothetical protein
MTVGAYHGDHEIHLCEIDGVRINKFLSSSRLVFRSLLFVTDKIGDLSLQEPNDERLVPNLWRGRGKSIGGDLDVDKEGSEQNIEPLQLRHPCLIRRVSRQDHVEGFLMKQEYTSAHTYKLHMEDVQVNVALD